MANEIVGDWKKLRKLGDGGQGEVWLAYQRTQPNTDLIEECKELHKAIEKMQFETSAHRYARTICETIWEMANRDVRMGALKILHPPERAKNAANAND